MWAAQQAWPSIHPHPHMQPPPPHMVHGQALHAASVVQPATGAYPSTAHSNYSSTQYNDEAEAPKPSSSHLPRDIPVEGILAMQAGARPFPDSRLPLDDTTPQTMFTEDGLKKYKGVTCDSRRRSQFRATLWLKGRNLHSPMVSSCVEAAAMYDHMVRQHKGMGNQVNFKLFDDEIQFQPYESKRLKGRGETEGASQRSEGGSSVGGGSCVGGAHGNAAKRSRSDMSSTSAREEGSLRKAARSNTLDSVQSSKSTGSARAAARARAPASRAAHKTQVKLQAGVVPDAGPVTEPISLPQAPPPASGPAAPPTAAPGSAATSAGTPSAVHHTGPVLPLTGVPVASATDAQVDAEVAAMAQEAGWPSPQEVPHDTAQLEALQERLDYLKGTYRGVYMVRPGRYRSSVTHRGKSWNTVSFPTAAAAAQAHDEMARKFKKRAEPMNFPRGDEVVYEPPAGLAARVKVGLQSKWDRIVATVRRKVATAGGKVAAPASNKTEPQHAADSSATRSRRRSRNRGSRQTAPASAAAVTVEGHALTLEAAKAAGYITAAGLRRQGDPQEAAALEHLSSLTGGAGRSLSAVGRMGGLALSVPRGVFTAYDSLERVPWQRSESYRHPSNTEVMLHGFMLADELGRDGHFSVCSACGRRGDLLMCDTCPAVYHPKCVPDVAKHGLPEGTWHCSLCQLRDGVMPALPLAACADDKQYSAEVNSGLSTVLAPLEAVRAAVAAARQAAAKEGDAAPAPDADDGEDEEEDDGAAAAHNKSSVDDAAPAKWLGVYAVRGKFRCTVNSQGRRLHVGFFPTALQAARAYDEQVRTVASAGASDAAWAASVQLNHPDTPEGLLAAQERHRSHAQKMANRAIRDVTSGATAAVDYTPWAALSALQQAERAQRYATPAHALNMPSAALDIHAPTSVVEAHGTVDEYAVGSAYIGVTPVGSQPGAAGRWGSAVRRAALNAGTPRSLLEGDDGGADGAGPGVSYCTHVALPGSGKTLLVGQWRDAEKAALAFNASARRTGGSAGLWGCNYVPGVGTGLVSVLPPFNAQELAAPRAQAVHCARQDAVRRRRLGTAQASSSVPQLQHLRTHRRKMLEASAGTRGKRLVGTDTATECMSPFTALLLSPLWGGAGVAQTDQGGDSQPAPPQEVVTGSDAPLPAAAAAEPSHLGSADAAPVPSSEVPSTEPEAAGAATESSAPTKPTPVDSSSSALRLGEGLYNFAYAYKSVYGAGTASALYAAGDALAHFEVVPRAMAGPRSRREEGVLLLVGAAAGEARRQGLSERLLADGEWVRAQGDAESVQGGDTDADSWVSEFDIVGDLAGAAEAPSCGAAADASSPAWFRLGANEQPEYKRLAASYVESSDSSDDSSDHDTEAKGGSRPKVSLLGGGLTALTLTGDGPHEPAGWCVLFGDSSDSDAEGAPTKSSEV